MLYYFAGAEVDHGSDQQLFGYALAGSGKGGGHLPALTPVRERERPLQRHREMHAVDNKSGCFREHHDGRGTKFDLGPRGHQGLSEEGDLL